MILENVNNSIQIYYAIGNSLIEGNFNEIPPEAFYAKIIQKLPYIDIKGEYKIHEIKHIIFLGTYIEPLNKIQLFNFNYGQPYLLYLYKNKDDIICNSYTEFTNKIQEYKEKYEQLQEKIHTKRKEKH